MQRSNQCLDLLPVVRMDEHRNLSADQCLTSIAAHQTEHGVDVNDLVVLVEHHNPDRSDFERGLVKFPGRCVIACFLQQKLKPILGGDQIICA